MDKMFTVRIYHARCFNLSYSLQAILIRGFAVEKYRSYLIIGDMMEEIGLTARLREQILNKGPNYKIKPPPMPC
jgi:hypothetical protein